MRTKRGSSGLSDALIEPHEFFVVLIHILDMGNMLPEARELLRTPTQFFEGAPEIRGIVQRNCRPHSPCGTNSAMPP
jgi:hypothetical protein